MLGYMLGKAIMIMALNFVEAACSTVHCTCAAQGMATSSIGILAQITTPAIVARYLDTSRHAPRLERLPAASQL